MKPDSGSSLPDSGSSLPDSGSKMKSTKDITHCSLSVCFCFSIRYNKH